MRIWSFILTSLFLISFADAQPKLSLGEWYIGFGIGSGQGEVTTDAGTQDYDELFESLSGNSGDTARVSVSLETGLRIAPRFFVGLHLAGMSQGGEVNGIERSIAHTQALGVVTYFPNRTGVFIRGGLGAATFNETGAIPNSNLRVNYEENGTGAMLGAGYAFRFGHTAHVTLTLDVHGAGFDGDGGGPSSAQFTALQLGVTWF